MEPIYTESDWRELVNFEAENRYIPAHLLQKLLDSPTGVALKQACKDVVRECPLHLTELDHFANYCHYQDGQTVRCYHVNSDCVYRKTLRLTAAQDTLLCCKADLMPVKEVPRKHGRH